VVIAVYLDLSRRLLTNGSSTRKLRVARRSSDVPDDNAIVSGQPAAASADLLAVYDRALPIVYGYLLSRCGRVSLAEDLTAETFLAAADAVRRLPAPPVSVPWIVGVARHKLVDHWRRQAREEHSLRAVAGDTAPQEDPWDARLDALRARETLERLGPHHQAALTLRYLDDLPVAAVAGVLDRSVHATEALLVRARLAFRKIYAGEGCDD
jgi:RNA polymerase sigma-70 factor (ECF subfamily)